VQDIPHGHGLSFKKGICDGLMEAETNKGNYHETHEGSYLRGVAEGVALRVAIAARVKPEKLEQE
jgi:hypothetical protein